MWGGRRLQSSDAVLPVAKVRGHRRGWAACRLPLRRPIRMQAARASAFRRWREQGGPAAAAAPAGAGTDGRSARGRRLGSFDGDDETVSSDFSISSIPDSTVCDSRGLSAGVGQIACRDYGAADGVRRPGFRQRYGQRHSGPTGARGRHELVGAVRETGIEPRLEAKARVFTYQEPSSCWVSSRNLIPR